MAGAIFISNGLCNFVHPLGGLCNRAAKAECADCATDVCHDCGQPCPTCKVILCRICDKDHSCKKPASSVRFGFGAKEELA